MQASDAKLRGYCFTCDVHALGKLGTDKMRQNFFFNEARKIYLITTEYGKGREKGAKRVGFFF